MSTKNIWISATEWRLFWAVCFVLAVLSVVVLAGCNVPQQTTEDRLALARMKIVQLDSRLREERAYIRRLEAAMGREDSP